MHMPQFDASLKIAIVKAKMHQCVIINDLFILPLNSLCDLLKG